MGFFMSDIKSLIAQLELYDAAYEAGNPVVPDQQYDTLKRAAMKQAPHDPYFIKVGSDVRGGKVKLPFSMGSLDQIYEGDYLKWCIKYALAKRFIVISNKLDGVSCMLQYKNGELMVAYSRGNGVEGADITRHVKKIKNVPQTIRTSGHLTIRGELIMKNETFTNNWADTFANPRNMVSGIFNRKDSDVDALNDVDFIAYQIVNADDSNITASQDSDILHLQSLGFQVVHYELLNGEDLNDQVLSKLLKIARKKSEYELDGIVLTINEKNDQKNFSNSSSLNPEHSVKFKVLDQDSYVNATVVKVHYELSKNGFYKPRVEINPIQLMGVTITFATGFNGKYIVDNQIGPGTIIKITRSGQVIPYITEVITPTKAEVPSDSWIWNDTEVEMLAKDAQNHPSVIFKQVLDFFETLDVDLLKEANVEKTIDALGLRKASYETIISTMLSLLEMEWENIIGSNGLKIHASLERRLNTLTHAKYLGAVKFFGMGFGVRKAKMLLKNLKNEDDVWFLDIGSIIDMEGFDWKTAQYIVNGLGEAKTFADNLGLKFIKEVKTNELAHLNVVFTGFRDKEFQEKLEKAGAKVGSSVSKKTTHLLTAEPNSTSSKAQKAREIGVKTMSLDEFKDEFNL
jgi:DNA ligase (NAD+)